MAQAFSYKKINGIKYFAIVLLMCLIAPFISTIIIIKVQQQIVKNAVRKELLSSVNVNQLTTFKFSLTGSKSLDWKNKHEFEFNGNMYDVVESNQIGDTIVFRCFLDKKETAFKRESKRRVLEAMGANPPVKENEQQIRRFFKSMFYNPILTLINKIPSIEKAYIESKKRVNSHNVSPPNPPPEVV